MKAPTSGRLSSYSAFIPRVTFLGRVSVHSPAAGVCPGLGGGGGAGAGLGHAWRLLGPIVHGGLGVGVVHVQRPAPRTHLNTHPHITQDKPVSRSRAQGIHECKARSC